MFIICVRFLSGVVAMRRGSGHATDPAGCGHSNGRRHAAWAPGMPGAASRVARALLGGWIGLLLAGAPSVVQAADPDLASQPASQAMTIGDSVTLSATATGTAPLACQWLKNGAPLAGQTNSTLNVAAFQFTDCGSYQMVVTNSSGMVADVNFGMRGDHFQFSVSGNANQTVVIEACTDLTNPVWVPLATNTLSSGGSCIFVDAGASRQPVRFYRVYAP